MHAPSRTARPMHEEDRPMKTATCVARHLVGYHGTAHHYRLSEPLAGHSDVVVSAVYDDFGGAVSEALHETYIFGANENGEVVDWGELDGSEKGHTDHARALRAAGYDIR